MPELTLALDPSTTLKTQQLHALLASVLRTVSQICSASDDCGARLDKIEGQIEEASGIDGVRVLRFRLEESLRRERLWRQKPMTLDTFVRLELDSAS